MKIITIATLKGGVGKTSVAYNFIGNLIKEGKKVLAIDGDAQGNLSSDFSINTNFDEEESFISISEIFTQNLPPEQLIVKIGIEEGYRVDVIPSTIELVFTEKLISDMGGHERFLNNWVLNNAEFLKQYDYIICDVGPNLGAITSNCLYASDEVYLVCDISLNAYRGCKLLTKYWATGCERLNKKFNVMGVIVNKLDKRNSLSKVFTKFISDNNYKMEVDGIVIPIFKSLIPLNIQITKSEVDNYPLAFYDTTCLGYKAFVDLIKEIKTFGGL